MKREQPEAVSSMEVNVFMALRLRTMSLTRSRHGKTNSEGQRRQVNKSWMSGRSILSEKSIISAIAIQHKLKGKYPCTADFLLILIGFSCCAYVESTTTLRVWSNPNQSNRSSQPYSYTPPLWWVFSEYRIFNHLIHPIMITGTDELHESVDLFGRHFDFIWNPFVEVLQFSQ